MVIRALDRKLLRDLLGLKAQVATTAVLVVCGVSLLIASWSAYVSLKSSRDSYYRDYALADIFCDLKRAPNALAAKLKKIAGVTTAEPRVAIDGLVGIAEPAVGRFLSIPSGSQPSLNRIYLRQGRLPVEGHEVEVAVHEGFASANKLRLGDTLSVLIQGTRETVRVVGIALSPEYVYALSPAAPLPDDRHFGIFWMPLRPLERLARMTDAFNSVTLQTSSNDLGPIKAQVDEILHNYGSRGSYGRDLHASSRFVNDEIAQQRGSAIITPMIFLGIAAFLIHIISSRLIAMHRPQIATLKAVGYANREVLWHYVKLIVFMMLAGAIPGIAVGAMLGKLYALSYENFFRFPSLDFSLNWSATAIGLVAGIVPGLLGAMGSITAAARLAPADAMRPAAMADFHAGFFDRIGAQRFFAVRQRMVWRNLLFRPFRLFLSIVGLSTAIAVVVSSVSWNDVVRFLLDTQFQRIQREDLNITFVSPVTLNGLRELSKLNGVVAVEGYRVAPIRIRFLNHKRELAITGWPESADMRQRLDFKLKSIPLPDEGVLLSEYFRKNWGMSPGDTVELETLEGASKIIPVKVAGFTQDLIGISASMNIEALWRTLGEQKNYNVATIHTDPHSYNELYVQLRDRPMIATVGSKTALYRGFQDTMGTMIKISTAILISFALAIAMGVIYNSIRVSFSERARELASLRVLGFTRGETYEMLLAEVGFQVLISILPGCLMGLGLCKLIMSSLDTEAFGFPVIIDRSTYATAIAVVLISFVLSALSVRQMIFKLQVADALKSLD